ncbi:EDD domain protein, DegV family [Carboxydocella thermautotrophica]|nr:EDD domain protein, DegV family [Carboxydocella thermautotrophica]
MGKVRIVTDSTADIPAEVVQEYGIKIVPLKVFLDGETYLDGVTLNSKEFYQRLPHLQNLPTTSQPSPLEFAEVYRELAAEGTQVISIHLSQKTSGTVQSARLGAEMTEGADITVIDSESLSIGLGIIVVEAARAAREGRSKEEIIALVERLKQESRLYFVLNTLDYIFKGGRIGKAEAFVGSLLNIKPILTMQDGVVTPIDKVRGWNKAIDRIVELVRERLQGRPMRCALLHANDFESVMKLHQRIVQEFQCFDVIMINEVGTVIGTYAGPGAVGIAFFPVEESV